LFTFALKFELSTSSMLSHPFRGSNGCEFIKETFVFHKSKSFNDFFAKTTVGGGSAKGFWHLVKLCCATYIKRT